MVMTQYGNPVDRVLCVDEKTGMATVEMKDSKGRTEQRDYFLHQLRADGGIKEVFDVAERVLKLSS